jgi:DNA-binding transcriptional ArsR family regulator
MTRPQNAVEHPRVGATPRRESRRDPHRKQHQQHEQHEQRRGQSPEANAEAEIYGEALTQREVNLFRLLAHPARLALLDAMRDEAACVCHLEALLGYPQAYISQQLAVLRSAGVIEGRREGWNVFYHVCDARLFAVLDAALATLSPADPTFPAQSAKRKSGAILPGCSCPRCSIGETGAADAASCDVRRTSADGQEDL